MDAETIPHVLSDNGGVQDASGQSDRPDALSSSSGGSPSKISGLSSTSSPPMQFPPGFGPGVDLEDPEAADIALRASYLTLPPLR